MPGLGCAASGSPPWLNFGLRITPESVICWPAAGISSGVLISLWSIARWPVLAGMIIATIVVNLLGQFSIAATAAWVVGNTAEPLIIAGLIQHYFGANFKLDRIHCVLGLFAAAVAGTAVAATWWTVVYWVFANRKEPTVAWLLISDLAGIVSVAPLVIGLAAALREPPPRREAIESLAALAVLGAMTGVIVSLPPKLWETALPAALVFPMLLWLAGPMSAGFRRDRCIHSLHDGYSDRELRAWSFWRHGSLDRRFLPIEVTEDHHLPICFDISPPPRLCVSSVNRCEQ
jgi:hypothetical protein